VPRFGRAVAAVAAAGLALAALPGAAVAQAPTARMPTAGMSTAGMSAGVLTGGTGGRSLQLTVTTNGIAQPLRPAEPIRAGDPVARTYLIRNHGAATLSGLTVTDAQIPAGAIRCPGGSHRIASLPALSAVTCTATAPARPGWHQGVVRVLARVHATPDSLRADVAVSYFGLTGALRLRELVNGSHTAGTPGLPVRAGEPLRLRYLLTNVGNVPLSRLTITDTLGGGPAIGCGQAGATVARLDPGQTHVCTAKLPTRAGRQRGDAVATGTVSAPTLTVVGLFRPPGRVFARDRTVVRGVVDPLTVTPSPAPTVSAELDPAAAGPHARRDGPAATAPAVPDRAAAALGKANSDAYRRVDHRRSEDRSDRWGLMLLTFVVLLVPGVIATRGLRRRTRR